MKYYIIAGEASGDLHGSNLIRALQVEDTDSQFRVWGGDKMQATGAQLVKHYKELAFMGFVEVAKNIRTISKNFSSCKNDIAKYQPDVLILIDYSGFNLRIAKWAKTAGFKIFYYISPQVWASRSGRVQKIKRDVDRMFVILPFEEKFYQQYNYKVDFVGHPLLDVIHQYKNKPQENSTLSNLKKPIIALLPGSRKQEINHMLPTMLAMTTRFPDYHFVIAGAPSQSLSFYEDFRQIAQEAFEGQIQIVTNQTYELLNLAKAAIVTSGTATLEAALFKVPEVVCYKGNPISYWIAKQIIKVKYISLVNLILDRPLVKELIQDDFTGEKLEASVVELFDESRKRKILEGYEKLQQILGNEGASKRAAQMMVGYLMENQEM